MKLGFRTKLGLCTTGVSVPITQPLWSLPVALLYAQSYPEGVASSY